jgi:DNA-binding winged helix-turn-helix (wHTH) protein
MTFRFGPFELDEGLWELRRGTQTLSVQRKALETILFLIHRRERVVSRDELRAGVWPDTVVSETAINHAIMQARRVIDGAGGPWIRTVRGRGLRFVGSVAEIAAAAATEPARAEPAQDPGELERHLLHCLQLLFRVVLNVARSATPGAPLIEVLGQTSASDDVLWQLAQRFREAQDTTAARQTLAYLVERFPASRLAQQATAALASEDGCVKPTAGGVVTAS